MLTCCNRFHHEDRTNHKHSNGKTTNIHNNTKPNDGTVPVYYDTDGNHRRSSNTHTVTIMATSDEGVGSYRQWQQWYANKQPT